MPGPTVSFEFDTSHPHYTPSWLSERVANHIPAKFRGVVVDPACGTGNLLAAAALHLRRKNESLSGVRLFGVDICPEAARACRQALRSFVSPAGINIKTADFLSHRPPADLDGQRIVIMNPPFLGYGFIPPEVRTSVRTSLAMAGKFNLSHAFVIKAIQDYRPDFLVSILPSNWISSSASMFRERLEEQGGSWTWDDVGNAFAGIAVHVGILTWRLNGSDSFVGHSQFGRQMDVAGFDIRQGVATGRDDVFRELARLRFRGGKRVVAVVGRDVARKGGGAHVWMPSSKLRGANELNELTRLLPPRIRKSLGSRACVKTGRKQVLQYHEAFPAWFLGQPKILLPEVVSGSLRAELDATGKKLPLHSVFAVRVPDVSLGASLLEHFSGDDVFDELRSVCQRLAGGAIRLNVDAIRRSVAIWAQKNVHSSPG